MPPVFLLAQTPRAGKENHRLLASQGAALSEAEASGLIGRLLRAAGEDGTAVAQDFLGVCQRGVFQASGERLGEEVLLLGGLNTTRLDRQQRVAVLERLRGLFPDLKALVERTDWVRREGMLIVPEGDVLGKWLGHHFGDLVHRPRGWLSGWMWKFPLALVALLVICLTLLSFRAPSPASPGAKDTSKTNKDPENTKELFDEFLRKRDLEGKEKRTQALRELAILLKRPPDSREEDILKPARAMLESRETDTVPYFFIRKQLLTSNPFKDLELESSPDDAVRQTRDIQQARSDLKLIATECLKFRGKAKGLELPALDRSKYPYFVAFKRLRDDLNDLKDIEKLSDPAKRDNAILPFFDERDWIAAEVAMKLRGFLADIPKGLDQNTLSLTKLFSGFRELKQAIQDGLDEEHRKLEDHKDDEKVVNEFKSRAGNLLRRLGKERK